MSERLSDEDIIHVASLAALTTKPMATFSTNAVEAMATELLDRRRADLSDADVEALRWFDSLLHELNVWDVTSDFDDEQRAKAQLVCELFDRLVERKP